jgi:hypothetical protein
LIPTGEKSGLLTHIATTESVSLCERMKTAFVELEAAIRAVSSQNPNESSLSGQRFAASPA